MAFRAAARGGQGQSVQVNNVVITIPATAVAGDVAIVFLSCSSNPTMASPPTGWTIESGPDGDGTNTFRGFVLSADITSGGSNDPGANVTFTISFAARIVGTMLVFSGRTRTGMQVGTAVIEGTAVSTHVLPNLTGVPAGADLVGGVSRRRANTAGTITASAGWTEPTNADVSTTYGAAVANTWAQGAYIANSAGGSITGGSWTGSVTSTGVNYIVSLPVAGPTSVSAALSGTGTLSTTQAPAVPVAAALSGSGSLSTTQAPAVARTGALSGSGTLSTTQALAVARTAALSGSGSLSAIPAPGWMVTGALSGSGTLSATTLGFATAALSGSGSLVASIVPKWLFGAALSGSGTLSVPSTAFSVVMAGALSGSGTLLAQTPIAPVSGQLSGTGYLVAHQVQALRLGTRVVTDLRLSTIRPIRVYHGNALVWQ